MAELTAGQPIKYRYSGQTENGAILNKSFFEIITASDALTEILRDRPAEFIAAYSNQPEQVNSFLKATVANWSANRSKEFDSWYRKATPEIRSFLSGLDINIIEIDQMGLRYIVESHGFDSLPTELILPESARNKIEENSRRIDADSGEKKFTYGILNTANSHYKETINFKLGDWHSWATLGGRVLTDPHYSYEVVPITRGELLDGLYEEIHSYDSLIEKGGIEGAVEARKQFFLIGIHLKIGRASTNADILEVIGSDNRFPAPETGVYVLLPKKNAINDKCEPFAVKANPRYDEDKIAGIMGVLTAKERGFETLLFQALEVPHKAIQYITDSRTLELRLT